MFNKPDIIRDEFQLFGSQAKCGYDWWWHSFTARHAITGEEKPFFIEFFLCNPALGKEYPIYGQDGKGNKPSYIMVKVGCWKDEPLQLHRFFGWKQANIHKNSPFSIEVEDCFLNEIETRGCVYVKDSKKHPEWMCDDGMIRWNLKIDKDIAYNVGYGASNPMRKAQLFEMFWHVQGMKTRYKGEIYLNGEKYIVDPETCYGYADKNWGKDFTSPWVWLSSNNLTSELNNKKLKNSAFDIGGGCPKVGPIALKRKLLSAFYYEGEEYEFNFSKFWTFTRTKFDCKETEDRIRWHVEQKTWRNKMITDVTCEKKDMLLVNYEAPNGMKLHSRLWNGGNGVGTIKLYRDKQLIDQIHAENIGCEYGEYSLDSCII